MVTPSFRYVAKARRIIDGDTFVFDVDLGFRISAAITVRVRGYDAPELRAMPEGPAAKAFAETVLRQAEQIVIESYKDQQSFARWLCAVFVDGVPFAEKMIAAGFTKTS